mmetsp:Transcript_42603/g.79965  ORF Transcript_42603/g.79965 Transcript_42603/m.79965 type:complete len:439 (-) Transcript_42603:32-1348(-)
MATEWTVLVFGDSWAQYMHPCWGEVLARRLSAKLFNFAQAGSLCGDLPNQAQRAILSPQVPKGPGGLLKKETLVVVHTGGNDFIQKMVEVLMGGGGLGALLGGGMGPSPAMTRELEILKPNPGTREATMLVQFCETMYRAGARHMLLSGVPAFPMPIFNMLWPIIGGLVNEGKTEDLGVSPGDPPQLVLEVQAVALQDRWEEMTGKFTKDHPDCACIFFDEVGALDRLKVSLGEANFNRTMWDMTMFHPSPFGHEQLASEAHRCAVEHIPALAALCPHPDAKAPTPVPALAVVPAAAPTAAPSDGQAADVAKKEEAEKKAKEEAERKAKEEAEAKPITVKVRNVKGDVAFNVACDLGWRVGRLRETIVATAPSGFVPAGAACLIALKGKFLQSDNPATLGELGIAEGSQLIAAVKAPAAAPPKAGASAAGGSGGYPAS